MVSLRADGSTTPNAGVERVKIYSTVRNSDSQRSLGLSSQLSGYAEASHPNNMQPRSFRYLNTGDMGMEEQKELLVASHTDLSRGDLMLIDGHYFNDSNPSGVDVGKRLGTVTHSEEHFPWQRQAEEEKEKGVVTNQVLLTRAFRRFTSTTQVKRRPGVKSLQRR